MSGRPRLALQGWGTPRRGCPRGCETPVQKLTSQETSLPGMGERGGGRGWRAGRGTHTRACVSV